VGLGEKAIALRCYHAIALRVKLFRSQVVKFTSWAALQNAI
jgi:hypothetical protein